ncbi:MAG: hypothetical protein AVDCRST_MAG45-2604, partial [uncultured Solirubrobacterales bacterium]
GHRERPAARRCRAGGRAPACRGRLWHAGGRRKGAGRGPRGLVWPRVADP